MLGQVARDWWVYAVRGVAAIIFGTLALVWPGPTLAVLVIMFGAYAFVDGIAMLVALARGDVLARRHAWATGLMGVLGIVISIATLLWPGITALGLLYMVAIWAISTGILQIAAAIEFRREIDGEGWMVLGGVLSIVFGTLLVVFPGHGAPLARVARRVLRDRVRVLEPGHGVSAPRPQLRLEASLQPQEECRRRLTPRPSRRKERSGQMDFQNQLDRLEQHVADLRAAVHAAAAETRQQLEQRIDKAQAETDRRLDEAKQQAGAAADRTQNLWEQKRSDAKARVAEIKSKAHHRRERIDANVAAGDADMAEAEAADAIDFADWAIENAQLAVLDALYLRARAADKAERVKVGA